MNRLIFTILFLCAFSASAASRYRATITMTNLPITGDRLIFTAPGSRTITWTNNTSAPTLVSTNTSIGGSSTNLYLVLAAGLNSLSTPRLGIERSSSNIITLYGELDQLITITTNNWATITYTTNTVGTPQVTVIVQQGGFSAGVTQTVQWIASQVVSGLGSSSNSLATNSIVNSNFLSLGISIRGGTQTIEQVAQFNKFGNSTNVGVLMSGILRSNIIDKPAITNGINYGNAFQSLGSGASSLQLGSNATATAASAVAVGVGATASGVDTMAIGTGAQALQTSATAVGNTASATNSFGLALGNTALSTGYGANAVGQSSIASKPFDTAIGGSAEATGGQSLAVGSGANAAATNSIAIGRLAAVDDTGTNSVAIGYNVSVTASNEIRLGTSIHQIRSDGWFDGNSHSNSTFKGTNVWRGDVNYPRLDLTTLAAGNNISVPAGTNYFIRVGAGSLTGAPTICGIIAGATTGGRDGQPQRWFNDTGYTLTFAVNTIDPVPANRINTPAGTDTAIADQGWADLFYDSTDARWKVIGTFPIIATSTNFAVYTNNVSVGSGAAVAVTNSASVTWSGAMVGGVPTLTANSVGSVASNAVTASRAALFNANKDLTNSPGVTDTELEYLDGVTSAIQTQLDQGKGGFPIMIYQVLSHAPADATIYYFGGNMNQAPIDYTIQKLQIPTNCTITRIWIKVFVGGTLGSGETVSHYLRLNDTTDFGQIDMTYTATSQDAVNSTVSQAVGPTDYISLKTAATTWATNPTTTRLVCIIWCRL
jgi:hypothetical protein